MDEFLNSWLGIVTMLVFDLVALVAVICLTYRWFFKRIFDVIVSCFCLVVTSPLFLAVFLRGKSFMKQNEGVIDSLTESYYRVCRKEKVVALHKFRSRDADGNILGGFGKWLESWKLRSLPLLLDVFCGRLSFIGVRALSRSDAEFVETDVEKDRFLVRPGLINPLVRVGDSETTYEEMFLSDRKYAWQFGFFSDCKIFFSWLLKIIRGEDDFYMGETRNESYAKYLLNDERITQEDFEAAIELDEKQD